MKYSTSNSFAKWLVPGLLILTALYALIKTDPSSAHPQNENSSRPGFTGVAQQSAEQQATILSQETVFDTGYFAGNGLIDGLSLLPEGLVLESGRTEGVYTSDAVASPLAFTTDIVPLWEVDLPEGAELRLETRLSFDQGDSWSEWLETPEAFYPVRKNLHSGNLIWAGQETVALQIRAILRADLPGVSPQLKSLVLAFSDTSQGPTDGEIAGQMARVSSTDDVCPVEKPPVVSRTDWGCPDGQDSPYRPPEYVPVTHIIIHQTETPNDTSPYQDWAGWVRSVWNYHANVLRWGDVGYNYLIDPNGVIYEGRAGGDDVVGIHDTHNRGSMAIGFIGCYGNCDDPRLSAAEPTEAMLDAATHLMAWKVGQKDLDPLGAASYSRLGDIPVIAGGRDVTWTSSPGDNLYNKLPHLRERVDEKADCPNGSLEPCQITGVIFGKESYDVGETIELTVRLADSVGQPLPGADVMAEVTRPEIEAQASTGFGLIDRVGEYDGTFSDTNVPGLYEFKFTATDPTGEQFAACMATASILVDGDATVTPSPTPTMTTTPDTPTPTTTATPDTPTATPTSTPSPTPTATATGTVLEIAPDNLEIPICDSQGSVAVNVNNVTGLQAVQLELTYDPSVVQVIDADPNSSGVQVNVGSVFSGGFIAQNTVEMVNGRVSFAATLLGSNSINGNAELITVDWQPQAEGSTALMLENVILANTSTQVIDFTGQNGNVSVISDCGSISGALSLQGRIDHSGVVVTNSEGQQVKTQANGSFSIGGSAPLSFEYPGYLSAEADVQLASAATADGFQSTNLGRITLLAGDVNQDNIVDIFDLTQIAGEYGTADPIADLNGDGTVGILDLVLTANNYGQRGPLTNWE